MADLHLGQGGIICESLQLTIPGANHEWIRAISLDRSKVVVYLLLLTFPQEYYFQPDSSQGKQLCMMSTHIFHGYLIC